MEKYNKFMTAAVLLIIMVVVIYFIASFFKKDEPQACRCLEVVGDESNFVCYTPSGEIDTKGECVGPKTYK